MLKTPLKYFGIVLIPFLTFLLGWNFGVNHMVQQKSVKRIPQLDVSLDKQVHSGELDLGLFWEAFGVVQNNFLKTEVLDDKKELVYGAIRGLVYALDDPYTVFMDPSENEEFKDSLLGQLEGIGAELTMKEGLLTVVSPLKNSPAAIAGLQPGDIIIQIDGEDNAKLTLEQSVMKIRGLKGTTVTLTVVREGEAEPFDIPIIRDVINIESVDWEMKEDSIAYISINQFGDNTVQEFQNAIGEILLKEPKGLILDVRFNSGGYLDAAVKMASEFLEEDKIVVTIKKRNGNGHEVYHTDSGGRMLNIPMVVLINKGSASAAEILAGSLQDYERAHLIGEASFGKATVQEVDPLSDGSSIRVTIAQWYTVSDKDISETGIVPDQEVKVEAEDYREKTDPQLDAAVEYLKNL